MTLTLNTISPSISLLSNLTASIAVNLLARYGISISAADFAANSLKTVVVGLSGGVDSSVSALILKLQGYRVIGIHMKNWHTCSPLDYSDVASVASALDIPYYSINLTDDYQAKVFDSFVADLNLGLTPNPDILCNKYIKFDIFFKYAMLLGADFVATGHYARITRSPASNITAPSITASSNTGLSDATHASNYYSLARPLDASKDQTYFLYAINPAVLDRVLFPLGDLLKSTTRRIASDFNLSTAAKKDSTGICFIDNANFRTFISDYVVKSRGNFIDMDGNILGIHDGLPFYTVGQKKGLNLIYKKDSSLARRYSNLKMVVLSKNLSDNTITLVPDNDPALFTTSLNVRDKTADFQGACLVRWRNLGDLVPAVISGNTISFTNPIQKVAPGQSVVAYNLNGLVLGGMIVC